MGRTTYDELDGEENPPSVDERLDFGSGLLNLADTSFDGRIEREPTLEEDTISSTYHSYAANAEEAKRVLREVSKGSLSALGFDSLTDLAVAAKRAEFLKPGSFLSCALPEDYLIIRGGLTRH